MTSSCACSAPTRKAIDLAATPPVVMMLVGLQGSGKTTTTAKLAKRLESREKQKVLMASLDTRRPAAQEQLRVLGEQTGVATLPIVAGEGPVAIATRALKAAKLGGYDVLLLDTAGRTHIDEELMDETADDREDRHAARDAARRRRADRSGRRQSRQEFRRARGAHRHRADPRRRRRTRRRGALDARRHRQADQAHRHRREARRARGFPSRRASPAASSAWATSSASSRRRSRPSRSTRPRPSPARCKKGAFDLDDLSEQLKQMQKLGGMGGMLGMLPGIGKVKKQLDAANLDDTHPQAPAGDDRLDDQGRAQEPEAAQCLAQEARRGGLGHIRAGHQQAGEDAPPDGRHDEDDGQEARHFSARCSALARRPRCRRSFPLAPPFRRRISGTSPRRPPRARRHAARTAARPSSWPSGPSRIEEEMRSTRRTKPCH